MEREGGPVLNRLGRATLGLFPGPGTIPSYIGRNQPSSIYVANHRGIATHTLINRTIERPYIRDIYLKDENQRLIQDLIEHPFNRELINGTLCKKVFLNFVLNDSDYLQSYTEACSVISLRALDMHPQILKTLHLLKISSLDERAFLRDVYLRESLLLRKVTFSDDYCNYIKYMASHESVLVSLAALLPCYSVFGLLGASLDKDVHKGLKPYYQPWTDKYRSATQSQTHHFFQKTLQELIIHESETTKAQVEQTLHESLKMEKDFFDSAYAVDSIMKNVYHLTRNPHPGVNSLRG